METALRATLALFGIGAAIRFIFSRGDVAMEQVGSVLMFLGGVGLLVAAILDRRERGRQDRR